MTPNPHEAAPALGMSRAGDNSSGNAFLPATMAARTIVATGERGGEHTLHARRKGEAREDACPERHRQDEEFEVRLGKWTSALAWARRSRVLTSRMTRRQAVGVDAAVRPGPSPIYHLVLLIPKP